MDGIRGSGIAVRALPADVVTVSFLATEPAAGQAPDAASSEGQAASALEAAGFKVLEVSKRFLMHKGSEKSSYFSPAASLQTTMTLRVTGFKNFADVLQTLQKTGVKHFSSVVMSSSKAEDVRDELEKEAIEKAVRQARFRAQAAGAKAGGVADLTVSPSLAPGTEGVRHNYAPEPARFEDWTPGQNLIGRQREGELPQIKYAVTATALLALQTE